MKTKEQIKNKLLNNIILNKDCWEWKGTKNKKGYGQVKYNGGRFYVHRLSYLIFIGDFYENKCVCHSCDNPSCINPKHLWLGTPKENTQDMIKKGRRFDNSKDNHPLSKLTIKDVISIKKEYSIGDKTQKEIAKDFGVVHQTISAILNNKRWIK